MGIAKQGQLFKPFLHILPQAQQQLWLHLQPLRSLKFVLYGGTAIALRLGHRVSVDFDFFSSEPLEREQIMQALPFIQHSTLLQDQANSLTYLVTTADSQASSRELPTVKLSLFGNLSFGRVGDPQLTADGMAWVASLDDLLATKLKVILQRAEAKDYSDIAALLSSSPAELEGMGNRLAAGLIAASTLYGSGFQPAEALKALVFFEDGDLAELPESSRRTLETAATQVGKLPAPPPVTPQLHAPIPAL